MLQEQMQMVQKMDSGSGVSSGTAQKGSELPLMESARIGLQNLSQPGINRIKPKQEKIQNKSA
jgi:hypothetical protein